MPTPAYIQTGSRVLVRLPGFPRGVIVQVVKNDDGFVWVLVKLERRSVWYPAKLLLRDG